ncbi:MAG: 5-oxoprolinase subunit PxpB, partial [Longimicrobiales bacterium]
MTVRILPLGDSALLIELGNAIDAATHARVRTAFEALAAAALPGVLDIVPAYTGLAVHYEPLTFAPEASPYDEARRGALAVLTDLVVASLPQGRLVEIPVRYGGPDGPDLDHVARHTRLSAAEVAALHASVEYTVYMIGFAPGFAYLGGLPPRLATPRRSSPRQAVPAGSVGIAGAQTGIYPLVSPGGLQIIVRKDERLFRPELIPPTLLRIGDL